MKRVTCKMCAERLGTGTLGWEGWVYGGHMDSAGGSICVPCAARPANLLPSMRLADCGAPESISEHASTVQPCPIPTLVPWGCSSSTTHPASKLAGARNLHKTSISLKWRGFTQLVLARRQFHHKKAKSFTGRRARRWRVFGGGRHTESALALRVHKLHKPDQLCYCE